MKVKYIGKTCTDLTNGNIYECLGKEMDCYRVVDESEEDYLYPIVEFEIVKDIGLHKTIKNGISAKGINI